MALYATNRFAGDGVTTSYEFNFVGKYLARSHVKAYQEDNATLARTPVAITNSNFLNDTTLYNLPVTPVGKTLVIYRDTPKPPLVDFTNGSRFTEFNMDLVARQGLFVIMEAMDARRLSPTPGIPWALDEAEVQAAIDELAELKVDLAAATGASLVGHDGNTLAEQLKNRVHRAVNSISALKALDKTKYTKAFAAGYYADGDGGGGTYYLDAADTTSPDNGGTVIVAADGGRWKLQVFDVVTLKQFGAVGDNIVEDTARIQAAISSGVPCLDGLGLTYAVKQLNGVSNQRIQNTNLRKIGGSVDQVNCLSYESMNIAAPITGVELIQVHIDGNRAAETNIVDGAEDGGRSGFRFRGYADGVYMERCSAHHCATDGLMLFAAQATAFSMRNFIVNDCAFNFNRRHGVSGDSLLNFRLSSVQANGNGLTLGGETVVTNGNHGAIYGGAIYGCGLDVESYGPNHHSQSLHLLNCEMTGNARTGVSLLEVATWKDGGFEPWRNITIEGGKYGAGVGPTAASLSIEITPTTSTHYPAAPWFLLGLRIVGVDLVNGGVLARYCHQASFDHRWNSVSVPAFIFSAISNTDVTVQNCPRSKVYTADGSRASYIAQTRTASQFSPPNVSVVSGAGTISSVVPTLVFSTDAFAIYSIAAVYTPVGSLDRVRVAVQPGGGSGAQILTSGLISRSSGRATGAVSPFGAQAELALTAETSTSPVDLNLTVLIS